MSIWIQNDRKKKKKNKKVFRNKILGKYIFVKVNIKRTKIKRNHPKDAINRVKQHLQEKQISWMKGGFEK